MAPTRGWSRRREAFPAQPSVGRPKLSQIVIGVTLETLVKDWLAQIKGRQYRDLIQHHVRRMEGKILASAVIGHIKDLPENIREKATMFIIEYGRFLLEQDSDIWGMDCVDAYNGIMANAIKVMPELEEYAVDHNQTTDGPIWTIFNALTLSISGAASDNKSIRKFIGVRKGLF